MRFLVASFKWLGWSALWTVVFFAAFYVSLDANVIKGRVERSLASALGYQVDIDSAELTGFIGLRLNSMTFTDTSLAQDKDSKGTRFTVDYLEIYPLSLFSPSKGISFETALFAGTAQGEVERDGRDMSLSWSIKDLDLSKLPWLRGSVSIPLKGRLSSSGDLSIPDGKMFKSEGTMKFSVKKSVLGDGKTSLNLGNFVATKQAASARLAKEGMTLPPLRLDDFEAELDISDGRVKLKDIEIRGRDVEGDVSGNLVLRQHIRDSAVTIYLKFKFLDTAKKKYDELEAMEAFLQARGKRPDGYIGVSITGTLSRLRIRPSRVEPAGLRSGSGSTSRKSRSRRSLPSRHSSRRLNKRVRSPRRPPKTRRNK